VTINDNYKQIKLEKQKHCE